LPVNSLEIWSKSDLISLASAKDKLFLFFLISFKNFIISWFSDFKPILFSSLSANFFKSLILTASGLVFARALSTALYFVLEAALKAFKSSVRTFWNKTPNSLLSLETLKFLTKSSTPDVAKVSAPSLAVLIEPLPTKDNSDTFSNKSINWPSCNKPGVIWPVLAAFWTFVL